MRRNELIGKAQVRKRLSRLVVRIGSIPVGARIVVDVAKFAEVGIEVVEIASAALGVGFVTANAFVRPAADTVLVLLLTWDNPPGQRRLVLGFGWEDYLCLLFGGLLFAVSWAMVEATRIETENAGFV